MSLGLLAAWCLLAATGLGWLPFARTAWAFNLWAYLPGWAASLLAAASLALCAPRLRDGVAAGFARAARGLPGGLAAELGASAAVALALFWLRERTLSGDSAVLVAAAHGGFAFVFPEVGATFLLRLLQRAGPELGLRPVEAMRTLACLCGGAATFLGLRVARELAPGWSAAAVVLFVFSGGLARVFAGRVEVYAPLLVAILAYLWTALRALRGAGARAAPALCLGVAIWLHASALLLLPSLLAIPLLRRPAAAFREALRGGVASAALAAAPLASFLLLAAAAGGGASVAPALDRAREILGQSGDPEAVRWWVRGWGGPPSIGTDVVLLGTAHLKYLLNAFALLVPAAPPLLAVLIARRPGALLAGPENRWLASAALPLVAYALALRPFWGPWDWDLFSATALLLAWLGVRLLFDAAPARAPALAVAGIGFQLLCFGIPFLWIGGGTPREAGPFAFRGFDYDLRKAGTPPPERLAPWL